MYSTDEKYMQRCLQLATKGRSNTKPNPMVGSIIVHNGRIIGEGYHKKYGEAHAEVNAIKSVKDKALLSESTLYVNLEPCAHHGKTPPCSDLIIENNIKRVVIGCKDSFAKVAGKGIERMRNAGIQVDVGILENESLEINKAFFTFHSEKHPYIILKWAQTLDGFIDLERKSTDEIGINWITNPLLKLPVHKWRSEESGILIGAGTLLNDNPKLDTREWYGKNPLRILIAKTKDINLEYSFFDGSTPTLVFISEDNNEHKSFIINQLKNIENTEVVSIKSKQNTIDEVLSELYKRDIQSLIIEGGQQTLQSFIDSNIWDEARVLIGNKTFGEGLKAPILKTKHSQSYKFANDRILHFKNQ